MKAAAAADAIVPSGVTVDAVDYLGPQLSARDTVLWWVADERTYAPWVVADITTAQYTFTSVSEQQQHVALLERIGYQVVFQDDGYIVLHRAGSATRSAPRRPRDEHRRPGRNVRRHDVRGHRGWPAGGL